MRVVGHLRKHKQLIMVDWVEKSGNTSWKIPDHIARVHSPQPFGVSHQKVDPCVPNLGDCSIDAAVEGGVGHDTSNALNIVVRSTAST